jgi:type IV pilus assembly protein PilY1
MRKQRLLYAGFMALLCLAFGFGQTQSADAASAIITNGTVTLGVNDIGDLNAPGGPADVGSTGLFFNPTGNEATAPGCLCEGWGVAVSSLGITGFADQATGTANVAVSSFSSTASTAVSVVTIANGTGTPVLKVTQDYHPSVSANLYQVTVTIENISGGALGAGATDLRYRRVMDWDIEPTAFSEFVTIGGLPATNVLFTNDNGFDSADPLSVTGGDLGSCGTTVNFTDCGPDDHGAHFDFGFPALAAGATRTFKIYYGAAATEAAAFAALAAVGAEVFSFGQCNHDEDPLCSQITGAPNTFIFAFGEVGGIVIPPVGGAVPEPASLLLMGSGLVVLATWRLRKWGKPS